MQLIDITAKIAVALRPGIYVIFLTSTQNIMKSNRGALIDALNFQHQWIVAILTLCIRRQSQESVFLDKYPCSLLTYTRKLLKSCRSFNSWNESLLQKYFFWIKMKSKEKFFRMSWLNWKQSVCTNNGKQKCKTMSIKFPPPDLRDGKTLIQSNVTISRK